MRNIIKKKKCLLFKHEKIIKHYPMTGRLIVTWGYSLKKKKKNSTKNKYLSTEKKKR